MSAPASLAASRESLAEGRAGTPVEQYKRYSADLTRLSEGDILTQGSNGSGSSSGSHKGMPRGSTSSKCIISVQVVLRLPTYKVYIFIYIHVYNNASCNSLKTVSSICTHTITASKYLCNRLYGICIQVYRNVWILIKKFTTVYSDKDHL